MKSEKPVDFIKKKKIWGVNGTLISWMTADFVDTGFPPLLSFEVSAQLNCIPQFQPNYNRILRKFLELLCRHFGETARF